MRMTKIAKTLVKLQTDFDQGFEINDDFKIDAEEALCPMRKFVLEDIGRGKNQTREYFMPYLRNLCRLYHEDTNKCGLDNQ